MLKFVLNSLHSAGSLVLYTYEWTESESVNLSPFGQKLSYTVMRVLVECV